ncbi:hypothetical protein MTsPCn9_10110 [Croceitalea sp. MTPC9]|uniref:hypothetical protein n=1 Tax=unclassified Croceitalea TaxID=2632280 RepID=UPI002B368BC6|nr:hypothetical protein MTsPCn6_27130 [Croceitalea sp. MTPC6]GMN16075.1 hypothetical protein MTsPCn9_10110 [Croceitalea sp. MTPC9]
MNTKALMICSALFLITVGLGLTFIPQEIAKYLEFNQSQAIFLTLQIQGSLYLGFGILNWMTKNNLIGGIYSRPLVIGNLMHFMVSSIALIKVVGKFNSSESSIFLVVSIVYFVFALLFGYVFITNPKQVK